MNIKHEHEPAFSLLGYRRQVVINGTKLNNYLFFNGFALSYSVAKYCALLVRHKSVCVRFAPSPTGFLHLGGLRTALYNHLFALSKNGKTILRIEDTDQERKVADAENQLVNDLTWCGLKYTEGPIRQSERLKFYKASANRLVENGHAYHCFCTSTRLDLIRKDALRIGQVPRYDNRCRNLSPTFIQEKLSKGTPSCIRFKLTPTPDPFTDLIYGEIHGDVSAIEGDPVILKTDGFPTYHLANVVDDHFMGVTHVLRGVEWQGSTQKHLLLYRAFGWDPPEFGHLPLLLNSDGSKLSKRQGDVDVRQYKDKGVFPLALINFVVRAGGGFDIDHAHMDLKSFTIEELAEKFDLKKIKGSSCKVDMDKLKISNQLELNRKIKNNETASIVSTLQKAITTQFATGEYTLDVSNDHVLEILRWARNRIHFLDDLLKPEWRFLWIVPPNVYLNVNEASIINSLATQLKNNDFSPESLKILLRKHATDCNIKFPVLMKILRASLSGLKEGPGVAEMMVILGRETVMERLERAARSVH